ncbi:hypothetical protein GlitD10_2368 [Gloeomargarita lithophora Alchichica-D10]|uniref:Uncharacterized protein n=1 Tax=Gloeomargarita lithophora Alchichica-D10 TaxID=1188229 RepID=A0A1J0AFI3_9CYAN|nr:hypothetical protein [Gloeomargarita lithophora]APB34702.1 hypothetical protein GlitD10_2368 [Gloeomargarita lithophora Alchichica-D10]
MTIFERLTNFVQRVFKTNLEIFLEALKHSPNAQGYVSGSITELLLKKKLEEEYGFEVKRIREKWEGKKHPNHHGDFYFRKLESNIWYVMESKGVKSNSEKWHKLYNLEKLKTFLIAHSEKIRWINQNNNIEEQVIKWIYRELPKFQGEFSTTIYEYEEIQNYNPQRKTVKSRAVGALKHLSREEVNALFDSRLNYVMSKIRVLETHFVSGKSASSDRTQATPRKNEFNVISIDIFLRYSEHKFLFANPQHLESSGDDENHLQQNYIMGFVFTDESGNATLSITDDWYESLNDVYQTLKKEDSIKEDEMQVDNRYLIAEEANGEL